MELSKQVVSLELAKKLEELGVKQESMFYWVARGAHYCMTDRVEEREPTIEQSKPPYDFPYISKGSAYTVSELMEMMPESIDTKEKADSGYGLIARHRVEKRPKSYGVSYVSTSAVYAIESADTLADALAQQIIKLIQDKLWKPTN